MSSDLSHTSCNLSSNPRTYDQVCHNMQIEKNSNCLFFFLFLMHKQFSLTQIRNILINVIIRHEINEHKWTYIVRHPCSKLKYPGFHNNRLKDCKGKSVQEVKKWANEVMCWVWTCRLKISTKHMSNTHFLHWHIHRSTVSISHTKTHLFSVTVVLLTFWAPLGGQFRLFLQKLMFLYVTPSAAWSNFPGHFPFPHEAKYTQFVT